MAVTTAELYESAVGGESTILIDIEVLTEPAELLAVIVKDKGVRT